VSDSQVLVVGGSIGGLTAAVLLRDGGFEVTVLERSHAALEGRGAGIVLHPQSARYLVERLGAGLSEFSERADWFRFLNRDGTIAHQQACCYRFTAWNSLYLPLRRALGDGSYHLGTEMVGLDPKPDRVEVRLADGQSPSCDLAVCADGISSTARGLLLPGSDPVFGGYLGWRGVVRESELQGEVFERLYRAITYYTPPLSHILSYPIPNPMEGERLLNYVWYRNVEGDPGPIMTDREGEERHLSVPPGLVAPDQVEFLRLEAEALLPPDLAEMVLATTQPFIQAVVDVEVPTMAFGRVCLLGDAAFAARPHAAAGTAKAAADTWDLAAALGARPDDIPGALLGWEPGCLSRGSRLVSRARRLGEMAQVEGRFRGDDDEILFGLDHPGDSCFQD
jgi:2,6-dihydroxypyridine 3-monooxygenase